jgi:prolyl 4-hydroxylase
MTMMVNGYRRVGVITTILIYLYTSAVLSESPLTCSGLEGGEDKEEEMEMEMDPGLQKMTFDIGSGTEVAWVSVLPNVSSFYRDATGSSPDRNVVTPAYKGQVCNFINLSDKKVVLSLEKSQGPSIQLRELDPMSGKGMSVVEGQTLFFADAKGRLIQRFSITDDSGSLHVYDPYYIEGYPEVTESYVSMLSPEQQSLYRQWRATIEFAQHYTKATGRAFLSHYNGQTPLKPPKPKHSMWRADYFGQEHWVTTREVHYDRLPPAEHLQALPRLDRDRELANDDPRLLSNYRVAGAETSSSSSSSLPTMNMTLKVLSCAPRVFEIANFLSPVEVQHILDIAHAKTLQDSSTGATTNANAKSANANRRSQNTWIFRDESPMMDSIYRRAADLLRIDEGLLRDHAGRDADTGRTVEQPTAAEPLQVVHYTPGQEYKTHVDFAYPRVDDPLQPTRFATLLLYLNDGMQGGETTFPRWMNAETSRDLQIKPELGKAVLFYSQLPDGNMDELSQHAALPVQTSEKYLANMWIWDPYVELSGM